MSEIKKAKKPVYHMCAEVKKYHKTMKTKTQIKKFWAFLKLPGFCIKLPLNLEKNILIWEEITVRLGLYNKTKIIIFISLLFLNNLNYY